MKIVLNLVLVFVLFSQEIVLEFRDLENSEYINRVTLKLRTNQYIFDSGKGRLSGTFRGDTVNVSHIAYKDTVFVLKNSFHTVLLRKKIYKESIQEVWFDKTLADYNKIKISDIDENSNIFSSATSSHNSIQLSNYGAEGSLSELKYRGLPAHNSKVMIEGIPLNNIGSGSYNLSNLSLSGISQLQLLTNGKNLVFGPESAGSALNSQLKEVKSTYVKTNFYAGSFNRINFANELNLFLHNTVFFLSYLKNSSDNYFPYLKNKSDFAYRNGADYENSDVHFHAISKVNENLKVKLLYKQNTNDAGVPGPKSNSNEPFSKGLVRQKDKLQLYLGKVTYYGKSFINELSIASKKFELNYINDLNKQRSLYLTNSFELNLSKKADLITNVSFSSFDLNAKSSNTFFKRKRDLLSFHSHLMYDFFDKFNVNLQFRKELVYRDPAPLNSPLLYNVEFNFSPFSSVNIKANFASHFRIPTFNELAFPGSGNPDIKPEQGKQGSVNLSYKNDNLLLEFSVFNSVIQNFIRWAQINGRLTVENIDEYQQKGLEASLKYQWENFKFMEQYLYNDFKDHLAERYYYVPLHQLSTTLEYRSEQLFLRLQHVWKDEYRIFNVEKLFPRRNMINFFTQFSQSFIINDMEYMASLYMNLYNLLNHYSPPHNPYPEPNFNYSIGLKIKLTI